MSPSLSTKNDEKIPFLNSQHNSQPLLEKQNSKNVTMTSVLQRRKLDRETRIQEVRFESHITNGRFEHANLESREIERRGSWRSNPLCWFTEARAAESRVSLLQLGKSSTSQKYNYWEGEDELVFYHNVGCSRASS